jgi:hypothetical protein
LAIVELPEFNGLIIWATNRAVEKISVLKRDKLRYSLDAPPTLPVARAEKCLSLRDIPD